MPTLIMKNTTAGELFLSDVGTNVPPSSQVLVDDRANLLKLVKSDSLRDFVKAGTVILNDGTADLSITDALGFLDAIWSNAGSSPVPIVPAGFIYDARLNWDSVSQVSIGSAGNLSVLKDSRGTVNITWKGVLTASMAVSGPGGLQTGSVEAANTWYSVVVIDDTSGVNAPAAILVPEGVSVNQSGYNVFRRVGFARNNGSSNFLKFFQAGDGNTRFILYDENGAGLMVLLNGAAIAPTDVDLAALVPPIGRCTVYLGVAFSNIASAAGDEVLVRAKGSSVTSPVTRLAPGIVLAAKQRTTMLMFVNGTRLLQYAVTNALDRADLAVAGYYDEI